MATPWAPDGIGISDETRDMIRPGQTVHLRLVSPEGQHFPRTACDRGLGEWWSGRRDEVTCTACLVVTVPA